VSLWQRVNDTYGRGVGWKNLVTDLEIKGGRAPPQARGYVSLFLLRCLPLLMRAFLPSSPLFLSSTTTLLSPFSSSLLPSSDS
jgi:hypothetical protein